MTTDDNERRAMPEDFAPLFQQVINRIDELERRMTDFERVWRCRVKGETCDKYVGSMREPSGLAGELTEGLSCEDYVGDDWEAKE